MAEHPVLAEVSFPHDTKEQFRSPAVTEVSTIPKVSFVIEWDNARLSEAGRARKMLQQLEQQVAQLGARALFRPELIVVYDRFAVDRQLIEQITHEAFKSQDLLDELKIIASDGLSYYDLKNFGARQTLRRCDCISR